MKQLLNLFKNVSSALVLMLISAVPFNATAQDPVAHWKFDETTGTTAVDELGSSNGTLIKMADSMRVDSPLGKAIDFSLGADSSLIKVEHNAVIDFDSTESFSVSILINLNELPSDGKHLFIKGNTGVNPDIGAEGKWYAMETKGGEFRFSVDDNVAKTQLGVNVSGIYQVGTWAHVVGVRDLAVDSLILYLNGVEIGRAKDATDLDISTALPLIIGNNHNLNTNFPGKIDELSIYNEALTPVEVNNLYETYASLINLAGSVAYWKLDESSGTTAKDELGISDGVLNNMGDSLWVEGLVGNCLNFAGGSDSSYVEVTSTENIDIDSTTSFSISVLVTTADINVSTDQNVLFKGATSNAIDGHWYGIIFKNNELRFAIDDKVTKSQLAFYDANQKMYLDGGWNHIVGVRDMDKDTMFIYLNGRKVASMEDKTELNISTPLPLIIGNNPEHNVNFEGKIDELIIYNKALSAETVAAMTANYGITPILSDDATLSDLKIDGTTIPDFSSATNTYDYEVAAGAAVPVITATASDVNAYVDIADAAAVPGTGTVTVTAENGSQLVYTVNYAVSTKVSDAYSSSGLNIYPNPVLNRLVIENESVISSITIYNTNGSVMNSLQDVNSKALILNLDELYDGLYLIKIITVDNDIISKTFMKK
ncbi:MAG: T9SS type A sorting domain-containing protein [Bacteroidales bacterium]|nr:T9SS type A sorting domain-containing protein [Bacteroidales bacterium]